MSETSFITPNISPDGLDRLGYKQELGRELGPRLVFGQFRGALVFAEPTR